MLKPILGPEWEGFEHAVIDSVILKMLNKYAPSALDSDEHKRALSVLIELCQNAFYAGAWTVIRQIIGIGNQEEVSPDHATEIIETMYQECMLFGGMNEKKEEIHH